MDERRIPFTSEDEQRIASTATWGIIIAVTQIGIAIVTLTASARIGLPVDVVWPTFIPPVIQFFLAFWLLRASVAFRRVARTDVADHAYLLVGFRRLRSYFICQFILILVWVALAVAMPFMLLKHTSSQLMKGPVSQTR